LWRKGKWGRIERRKGPKKIEKKSAQKYEQKNRKKKRYDIRNGNDHIITHFYQYM
jgi:hypothetical protein